MLKFELMMFVKVFFLLRKFFINNFSDKCSESFFFASDSQDYTLYVFEIFFAEAGTRGVLWEMVFLEISQNSQENTSARVSF